MRCRGQLMGEVYEKALRRRDLSGVIVVDDGAEKKGGGGSTGKIVQLLTQDTGRYARPLRQGRRGRKGEEADERSQSHESAYGAFVDRRSAV